MKFKDYFLAFSGLGMIIYLFQLFTDKGETFEEFQKADDKKKAELRIVELKEEIAEIPEKKYSDDEIEKKFN